MLTTNLSQSVASIIVQLGGQAVFLAAAAWLIKSLVTNRLAREAEQFRIGLQSQANMELERLRNSLQLAATEHQVRFANLHEKRALVIAELYSRLIQGRGDAARFILPEARDKEVAGETNQKMLELYHYITLNRIYLPEKVCELVDEFEATLRKSVINVDVFYTRTSDYPIMLSPENQAAQNKVMLEACTFLESKSAQLLKELVGEFRLLLGEPSLKH